MRLTASEWGDWWKRRGKHELALLLWALWDPIGGVPLSEYVDYCDSLGGRLRAGASADEVAAHLRSLEERMIGLASARTEDAAERIVAWHAWSCDDELGPRLDELH
jgi:hypothetical protein